MSHPIVFLDDVVHQRTRLGVLTVLAEGGRVQFGFLRDTLALTDGNLSRHLVILEGAGLIEIEKGYQGRRPRTWITMTRRGKRALAKEVASLKALVRLLEIDPTETPLEEAAQGVIDGGTGDASESPLPEATSQE